MGCLIAILAMIGPRVALFFVWIATGFVDRAYDGFLLPALGFVFLPWTTLAYALAYDGREVSGIGWVLVAIAVVADFSSLSASGRQAYITQRA
jgi:hypothetical protein